MGNDPKWWNNEHSNAWERVKTSMKRDWEQTKSDVGMGGTDLDQDAGDTVRQATGKERTPSSSPSLKDDDKDWDRVENNYRYGVGARQQYGKDDPEWTDRVESKLKEEWKDLKSGKTWDEVKGSVRRAWERVSK